MPQFSTLSLHSDIPQSDHISPPISTSTTFRHTHPLSVLPTDAIDPFDASAHVLYSRFNSPTLRNCELVISALTGGQAILYSSGLAAVYAALVHLSPRKVALRGGYHGCHNSIKLYARSKPDCVIVDLDDPSLGPGDLIWLETPVNPLGEVRNIAEYSAIAKEKKCTLLVDSTFAPPPIADPLLHGADIVLHSATKYFGGHTDILAGVLVVRTEKEWRSLHADRSHLGSTPGSHDVWLLLRSLRTLGIRVKQQCASATALASWLKNQDGFVEKVWHASFQKEQWVGEQIKAGPACFGFLMKDEVEAKFVGHCLKYFAPATSLGGVESLIEQRVVTDPSANPCLIRVSVGLEDIDDLKADLAAGFLLAKRQAAEFRVRDKKDAAVKSNGNGNDTTIKINAEEDTPLV